MRTLVESVRGQLTDLPATVFLDKLYVATERLGDFRLVFEVDLERDLVVRLLLAFNFGFELVNNELMAPKTVWVSQGRGGQKEHGESSGLVRDRSLEE